MVALGDAPSPAAGLLEVVPNVQGELRWHGTQTLVLTPSRQLNYATEYRAVVRAGLVSVGGDTLNHAISWTFKTPSPSVQSVVWGTDADHVQPRDTLFIHFNQPVDAARIAEFVSITAGGRSVARTVQSKAARSVAVIPSEPLPLNSSLRVALKRGLPSPEGPGVMEADTTFEFRTYGPGRVLSIAGSGRSDEFSAGEGLQIHLSNAVSPEALEEALSIVPSAPFATGRQPETSRVASSISWPIELAPSTNYTVTIAGLVDVYGQNVPTFKQSFTSAAYAPQISLPAGMQVIESQEHHQLAASSVNIVGAEIGLKRVSIDEVVPNSEAFGADWADYYADRDSRGFDMKPLDLSASRDRWRTTPIDLDPVLDGGVGIVLVNAFVPKQKGWYGAKAYRSIVQVTNLGITAKYSPHQIVVLVSSLDSATPVVGAEITLRDKHNAIRWTGKTGEDGTVQAPGWDALGFESDSQWERPRIFVFARSGADVSFASSERDRGIEPYRMGVSYDWNPTVDNAAGSVFTDRGLYRTGDSVHVKAIVRRRADLDWHPWTDSAFVRIRSPLNENQYERSIRFSDFGSFDLSWMIPDDAAQGSYQVSIYRKRPTEDEEYSAGIAQGSFRVDAFRTSTFSVTTSTSAGSYVAGDYLEGKVSGRYLFGAPMSGQPVSYTLTRTPTSYSPDGYEGYRFGRWTYDDPWDSSFRRLGRADTLLGREGELDLRAHLPGNAGGTPMSVVFEGTVTDPARQTLSGRSSVVLHPGLFYVGLKPRSTFVDLSKDAEQSVDIIVVDPTGAPASADSVALSVVRRQWNSVREVGADGRLRWRSMVEDEPIAATSVSVERGTAKRFSFKLEQGGSYVIRARSHDIRGNFIQSEAYFYATGGGYVAWERKDDDLIELVADRSRYAPGDIATIMIPSPFESAEALITVEREGILSSHVERLSGSAPKIEIQLTDDHIPNAYVSVILLNGRSARPEGLQDIGAPAFRIGYVNLSVDPGERHLSVDVSSDKKTARPGDEITVNFRVRDRKGNGVPAEVTFSAADAGVLQLIDYSLPDPFGAFYGERPLGVSTTESRAHLVRQRNFGQKEEDSGGGGGGQGSQLRTDFRPLAHWEPALKTGPDGRASVTFRLPESLTTFRLMAVAATMDSKFGYGSADIVVTKPLVLQQALPRFARLGDRIHAGVVVTNQTGSPGNAEVTVAASGVSGIGALTRTVSLAAGQSREVSFDWLADSVTTATMDFTARLGSERDAMRATFPVVLPTVRTVTGTFAQTDSSALEVIRLPSNRISSLDRLTVSLSSTALVGLDGATDYLFEYPYGCLEQRTSRIRPLLIASDLVDAFDLDVVEGQSRTLVSEWLTELRQYWNGDGFALWPGGRYNPPFVNAYVLAALAEARDAGYEVPADLVADAIGSAERMARRRTDKPEYYDNRSWRLSRAYLLYALARHDRFLDDEILTLSKEELDRSDGRSPETAALLLRAIGSRRSAALDPLVERLLDRVKSGITVEPTTAFVSIPDRPDYWWTYSTSSRATALVATVLSQPRFADDAALVIQRMIRYLLSRRQAGHWASTQENIAVIEAMATFFQTYESEAPDFVATVDVAGRAIVRDLFEGRTFQATQHALDADLPGDSTAVPVRMGKTGTGTLYYSLRLDTYAADAERADNGLSVSRSIQRLDRSGAEVGNEVAVNSTESIELEAGELVRVTLRLNSRADRHYVVVDDALPAGLEALNSALSTTSDELTRGTGSSKWWGSFNHTEMRQDRVLLFADFLQRGDHTYQYVARATTPGTYNYPPVVGELMYEPTVNGRTSSTKLTVRQQ